MKQGELYSISQDFHRHAGVVRPKHLRGIQQRQQRREKAERAEKRKGQT